MVPHVNNRESAEAAMGASKFAPLGYRGMFPGRQSYGVGDYFQNANNQTMVVVLLEEIEALRNLDQILEVDYIDVFFIAPMDLAASMGHVGDRDHPDVQKAIVEAEACIGRSKGALGGLCLSASEGNEKIQKGYQVLLMGFDLLLIEVGVKSMLDGLNR